MADCRSCGSKLFALLSVDAYSCLACGRFFTGVEIFDWPPSVLDSNGRHLNARQVDEPSVLVHCPR